MRFVQFIKSAWVLRSVVAGAAGVIALGIAANDVSVAQEVQGDNIANSVALPEPNAEESSIAGSSAGATLEAGETAPCGDIGATIWHQFSVFTDTPVVVDTGGSDFPTIVAAYTLTGFVPSPPGGSLANVACDASDGERARITFTAMAGERYYVQVGGVGGATGTLAFRLACEPACPPLNDDFLSAQGITPPVGVTAGTQEATLEAGEPQPCGNIGATVWYAVGLPFFATNDATLFVDTLGSEFDTVVALYAAEGIAPSPPGSAAQLTLVTCVDDPSQLGASLEATIRQGIGYYVQIGGRDSATGVLQVQFDCRGCPISVPDPTSPDTGGGQIATPQRGGGGPVSGPNTGNGGYR
jgi:hypothetical protein